MADPVVNCVPPHPNAHLTDAEIMDRLKALTPPPAYAVALVDALVSTAREYPEHATGRQVMEARAAVLAAMTPTHADDEALVDDHRRQAGLHNMSKETLAAGSAILLRLSELRARAAVLAAMTVPEGWVLVPVEPTNAMQDAVCAAILKRQSGDSWDMRDATRAAIKAMLAALPEAPK